MRYWIASILLCVTWTGTVSAQERPTAPPISQNDDPSDWRSARERAVTHLHIDAARAFVEMPYGADACDAVFACSLPVAQKLAECHAAGELDKVSSPQLLLRVIAQHGDKVALYAIHNIRELQWRDNLDAFLCYPLDIALDLKPLDEAAAEVRASRRLIVPSAQNNDAWRALGIVVGGVGLIALIMWRLRRNDAG